MHANEDIIEQETDSFVQLLRTHATDIPSLTILGPAKPIIYKIQNIEIRTIFIKGSALEPIIQLYKKVKVTQFASSFFFTPLW